MPENAPSRRRLCYYEPGVRKARKAPVAEEKGPMRLVITLTCWVGLAGWAWAQQDPVWQEIRFYRVHLRNGNFIDGDLVKQSSKEVVLRLRSGEISIRSDQIDRLEFVKMRDVREVPAPVVLP